MKVFVKRILILTLFLISAAGYYMHYSYHPLSRNVSNFVPFISGILSVFILPVLFSFRKTIHWAYLINGFTCIVGVITMTHFSLAKSPIYQHIALTIAKFFIGWAIFQLTLFNMEGEARHTGWRTIRYPNLGFWAVHLASLSLVYWLGHTFWRN